MKISEETNDADVKEQAKVNFGMANASLKWNDHVSGILAQIEGQNEEFDEKDNELERDGDVQEAPAEDEEENNWLD